jgi:hypothetical protein
MMVNAENLRELADYLDRPEIPADFDMMALCEDKDGIDLDPHRHTCGTVMCALGNGPAAGIKPAAFDKWDVYCTREFGVSWAGDDWSFMFDSDWAEFDNTRQGAARRIRYVADHGKAPDGWTYETPFPVRP